MMIEIANVFTNLQTVKILVRALSKNRRFRKRFDSQHVKVSQILSKHPSEHFFHLFSSFWGKLIRKISRLVLGEILGVFVETLPADAKYLLNIKSISNSQLKCKYLKNENLFLNFLFDFWNLHQISNILKKNMMVIANAFLKLQTLKILVRPLSKKRCFRKRFDRHHVKVCQILCEITLTAHLSSLFIILR